MLTSNRGGGSKNQNKLQAIINKIKEAIEKTIGKIRSFLTNKKTEKAEKTLKDALNKNPKLRSKKVKVKDYDKAMKRSEKALKDVRSVINSKSKPEEKERKCESIISKYKKEIAVILSTTVLVGLGVFTVKKKAQMKANSEMLKNLEAAIERDIEACTENYVYVAKDPNGVARGLISDQRLAIETDKALLKSKYVSKQEKILLKTYQNILRSSMTLCEQSLDEYENRLRDISESHLNEYDEIMAVYQAKGRMTGPNSRLAYVKLQADGLRDIMDNEIKQNASQKKKKRINFDPRNPRISRNIL